MQNVEYLANAETVKNGLLSQQVNSRVQVHHRISFLRDAKVWDLFCLSLALCCCRGFLLLKQQRERASRQQRHRPWPS